jgi:hypothetical protein
VYRNAKGAGLSPVVVAIVLFAVGPLRADEAVLLDAKTVRGKLHFTRGRLSFTPAGRKASLRLDRLDQVRLPSGPFDPARLASVHRLSLRDGSGLTGQLLGVDRDEVRFRPTWANSLAVPREAVASIQQQPGSLTFVDEDFDGELKGWKLAGKAGVSEQEHTSGKRSLLLSAPGQSAVYALARPLAMGRLGINFCATGAAGDSRCRVEVEFSRGAENPKNHTQPFHVMVAGPSDAYELRIPGVTTQGFRILRSPGWHRLGLEFGPTKLLVTIDGDLLWVSREKGPGGPLRAVRLVCDGSAGSSGKGQVYFDDFALARPAGPLRHPTADPGQDELWLRTGDQLLGTIAWADRRRIDLHARFGKRTWDWGEVRGLFFRQRTGPVRTSSGEQITVWLRTGAGPQADRLTGQVLALDQKQLRLRHPILGDLAIPRGRVRRVRWVFHGRRIDLDAGSSHLGPKGKIIPGLYPPRAEGPRLGWSFPLARPAGPARLRLQVVHVKGREDGDARAWQRGELGTEVWLNGKFVDYLNHHVLRSSPEPLPVTIPLPKGFLRAGDNRLDFRQKPERQTGHLEHCGVSKLLVEVPE